MALGASAALRVKLDAGMAAWRLFVEIDRANGPARYPFD